MFLRRLALLAAVVWTRAAAVRTPASCFGHPIGADRTVLDWDKVVGCFQALAKSSGKIKVEELGKSTEGRPFLAATIADAGTLKHLDRYIAIQKKLADPRTTPPAEAERLILEGKAVVTITCSIHATEIAPAPVPSAELSYLLQCPRPARRPVARTRHLNFSRRPLSACYSRPNAFSARPQFCAGPQPTFSALPAWRKAQRRLAFDPARRGYSAWSVVSRQAAPDIRPRQLPEANDLISSVIFYHRFSESVQGAPDGC